MAIPYGEGKMHQLGNRDIDLCISPSFYILHLDETNDNVLSFETMTLNILYFVQCNLPKSAEARRTQRWDIWAG